MGKQGEAMTWANLKQLNSDIFLSLLNHRLKRLQKIK
jgi:hypothetical protein